jgi:lipopolysaccharide/colanic/teichoic acid biosynthesis glycosyltransferase
LATRIAHIREATTLLNIGLPTADGFYLFAKRLLDIVFAVLLLTLLAPLMALIALAIALDSPGPVIFRQRRVLGDQALLLDHPEEQVFEFLKFRTMVHHADENLHRRYVERLINGQIETPQGSKGLYKLDRDPRVTRVGQLLRKTSLDELPQLVNILRGEMSFVGPRPAIPYEVRQYKSWHLRRLAVTQGLTGLWQVTGRNQLCFDEMVQLDIEYARRRSLVLDLKIMLATIPAVFGCRGVC